CWGSKGDLIVRAGTGNCGSNCGPVGHSGCVGISDFSCNGTLLTGNILGGWQSQASQDSVNIVNKNSAPLLTKNVTINGAAWTAPNCTGTTVPCTTGYETNKICVGSGCSGTPSKQITGTITQGGNGSAPQVARWWVEYACNGNGGKAWTDSCGNV